MAWFILLALVAVFIGILASGTTVKTGRRVAEEPLFRLTIVWPNGDVTKWPR